MKQRGFTLVELLIVIVVIAILAAVSIVAYNGISNRAYDSAIKTGLKDMANKQKVDAITDPDGQCYVESPSAVSCLNNSPAFKAISQSALATGTDSMRYYASDSGESFRQTIAAKSKSGNIFLYENGVVRQITLAEYPSATCSPIAAWSQSAKTWYIIDQTAPC